MDLVDRRIYYEHKRLALTPSCNWDNEAKIMNGHNINIALIQILPLPILETSLLTVLFLRPLINNVGLAHLNGNDLATVPPSMIAVF